MKNEIQLEGHKLMYHVNEVSDWLNGKNPAPVYVEIGATDVCNHKCIFCALDYLGNKGHSINKEILIKTLQNMAKLGVKSVMFGGEGEPLLYKDLSDVIIKGKESNLDISITSNGVLFNEDFAQKTLNLLSWIKFSIDAGTDSTYEKVHKCRKEDFNKVLNNIQFASKYRNLNKLDVAIGAQMLMISENINEVEDLIVKIKDLGLDYLALKPYSKHPDSVNNLEINLSDYDAKLTELSERYSRDDFKVIYRNISLSEIEKKKFDYNICYGINFFVLITAKGDVIPCNLFYNKSDFYYGNINEMSFEDIWKSQKRKDVVEKIYKQGCSECRVGCRLNFINKYLDVVKNRNLKHINFI